MSTDYFKTLGVPIVEGRAFTDDDRPDTPRVAIVNETFARRYWPRQSAIGKTSARAGPTARSFEIVGVSADHKVLTLSEPPTPFLHIARNQRPSSYSAIIARTRGDADGAAARHAARAARARTEPRLRREPDDGGGGGCDAVPDARRAPGW